jgi:hypothetical protein
MDADEPNTKEVMSGRPVASWASIFLDYLDLKAHLLAEESKEAAGLLVLLGVLLALALSCMGLFFCIWSRFFCS